MDIRLFKYALELYRQKNFTKAAQQLHIAQPSLSQQIKKLEADLGVTLFYRERGQIQPTPEGLRFLEQAEKIVQMRDDLIREMKEMNETMGSELTIGAPVITGGHLLPPILKIFAERYPHVHVRLVEETPENLESMTAEGAVDLSVLPLPIEDERLTTQTIMREVIQLALPKEEQRWMSEEVRKAVQSFRLGTKPSYQPLPLNIVANVPFILLKQGYGFRRFVLDLCAESGFRPQTVFETSSIETAQSLVAYGLGVTLVPKMVVRVGAKIAPMYVSIQNNPARTIVFAYSRERYLNLAARAFLQIGSNYFDE